MDPLVRTIKVLTVAVWCLCVLIAVQIAIYGVAFLRSTNFPARNRTSSLSTPTSTSHPAPVEPEADAMRFHDLPPDQMVAQSSAILLVSYQRDGDRYKAVVAEVLKKNPDAELYYGVGDEMRMLSYYPKDGQERGEGQVVFMVGSPAEMRSGFSFDAGRIGGLGDMPLDALRGMVKGSSK